MTPTSGTRRRHATGVGSLFLMAAVAFIACGPQTQHDILNKAEGIETKQELEAALGQPDEVDKLGPIEKWT